jgi:hypothetical protein
MFYPSPSAQAYDLSPPQFDPTPPVTSQPVNAPFSNTMTAAAEPSSSQLTEEPGTPTSGKRGGAKARGVSLSSISQLLPLYQFLFRIRVGIEMTSPKWDIKAVFLFAGLEIKQVLEKEPILEAYENSPTTP